MTVQHDLETVSLRQAFGSFVTGVTVVTTIDTKNRPRGITANSFTSVSMKPPLVLVCVGQSVASYDEFCATDSFAINILSDSQQFLSELFASKAPDKFEKTAWRQERSGSPVLDDGLAWIDCAVHKKIVAGDHSILIGRVLDFGRNHGLPLGFFGGSYVTFNFYRDAESLIQKSAVIGGIVEVEGHILLCRDTTGKGWTIPTERHLGAGLSGREALVEKFRVLGISINPTFVYSLFTNNDGALIIVYRCTANPTISTRTTETQNAHLFSIDQLPWSEINEQSIRAMLTRYIHERTSENFGIYVESENGGRVGVLNGDLTSFQSYQHKEALR